MGEFQKMADVARGKRSRHSRLKDEKESRVAVLPDEKEQQRAARRKAAKRFGKGGSGRASTVMSTDNRLGG